MKTDTYHYIIYCEGIADDFIVDFKYKVEVGIVIFFKDYFVSIHSKGVRAVKYDIWNFETYVFGIKRNIYFVRLHNAYIDNWFFIAFRR